MKRYLVIVLAVVCAMTVLAGCQSEKENTTPSVTDPETQAKTETSSFSIEDLMADNELAEILKVHKTVTAVSEFWKIADGEEVWSDKQVEQYDMSTGTFVYNHLVETENDKNIHYGYRDSELTPVAYCTYDEATEAMTAVLFDTDVSSIITDMWMYVAKVEGTEVLSVEEDPEYNTKILHAGYKNEETGYGDRFVFFVDATTGYITGMEHTIYDLESSADLYITRMNIFYDDFAVLEDVACQTILTDTDACEVTFVLDPGQDTEATKTESFAKGTEISASGLEEYIMYADEACTTPIETIDTTKDQAVVYLSR